jgi:hypothetical protein
MGRALQMVYYLTVRANSPAVRAGWPTLPAQSAWERPATPTTRPKAERPRRLPRPAAGTAIPPSPLGRPAHLRTLLASHGRPFRRPGDGAGRPPRRQRLSQGRSSGIFAPGDTAILLPTFAAAVRWEIPPSAEMRAHALVFDSERWQKCIGPQPFLSAIPRACYIGPGFRLICRHCRIYKCLFFLKTQSQDRQAGWFYNVWKWMPALGAPLAETDRIGLRRVAANVIFRRLSHPTEILARGAQSSHFFLCRFMHSLGSYDSI